MTDKILIDRSVVEQALGALNASMPHNNDMETEWPEHIAARRALRAALEQPDKGNPISVPDGWKLVPVEPTDAMVHEISDNVSLMDFERGARDGYRAMLAAAPQPRVEQKPIAWANINKQGDITHASNKKTAWAKTPLYIHPQPPRQPLTDQQIHDCFQHRHRDKATERVMITRAIEAAHGIKEQK